MNIILGILPLREWHRDPSMVSGSRGQSDAPSHPIRNYHPRSYSYLNFSPELLIAIENGYYKVRKEIHCPLHEWHRDPSMILDREDRVTHQSFVKRKYHPRLDSSLNFSSELSKVSENKYHKVRKEIRCSLHEWHRDPSMILDREDRVAHHNFVQRKYNPRPDSSWNFSSELPIVSENEYHKVRKEIHCTLHEWHRDPSMILDREDRVAHQSFMNENIIRDLIPV